MSGSDEDADAAPVRLKSGYEDGGVSSGNGSFVMTLRGIGNITAKT